MRECQHLRYYLINRKYIEIFMHLTQDKCKSLSVALILAHIGSSGLLFWNNIIKQDLGQDRVPKSCVA
jgi:hypothetical protein